MENTKINTKRRGIASVGFTIEAENTIKCSGYKPYQGGYGTHGKSKKGQHKADRKAFKMSCRNYDL